MGCLGGTKFTASYLKPTIMQDNTNAINHADVDESTRDDWEQKSEVNNSTSTTNATYGSGPSGPIADGGGHGRKQPKEKTGKDSTMGGADGGTAGLGFSKEIIDQKGEE